MIRKVFQFFTVVALAAAVASQVVDDLSEEEAASTHMPRLLSSPTVVEATVGETVALPCEVDDIGSFVRLWKKGKSDVLFAAQLRVFRDDRFQVDENSLKISNVQAKDSGEYICQISTNPQLEVIHSLDVLYPPTIKPEPRDGVVTVKEGESVTLMCESTGNPMPSITWKHAGRNYDITDGNKFTISNALKSASGEYECIADNGVGDPASAVITVEVVSAPKVFPKPEDGVLVVKEGDVIEIACEATGDPLPVISWKTPGGNKAYKSRDGDRIVISEAERNHAGAYECIANNSLGVFTSAIIRVNVLYQPEIKVQNSWIHAGEGTAVNMTCIIKGEPTPSVMWKRSDGKVIHSNEHYHLKANGHHYSLQIRHLKEDDFGRYECIASNSLGSVEESIHIIGTPQVPSFTSNSQGTHGRMYTLVWMVKSPSPVQEYSLIYRKKSENEEWTTVTIQANKDTSVIQTYMHELKNLQPGTSYEAMVTARNKFGWSKQSDTFTFTTKNSELTEESVISSAVDSSDKSNSNGHISATADSSEKSDSNEKRSEAMLNRSSHSCISWSVTLIQASVILIFGFFH